MPVSKTAMQTIASMDQLGPHLRCLVWRFLQPPPGQLSQKVTNVQLACGNLNHEVPQLAMFGSQAQRRLPFLVLNLHTAKLVWRCAHER